MSDKIDTDDIFFGSDDEFYDEDEEFTFSDEDDDENFYDIDP